MRAIVRDEYGTADVLKLEDVGKPTIGDDEVLLRAYGSSINMGDRLVIRGAPYAMRLVLGLFRPRSRGTGQDVAGRVEAVGENVTEWVIGDELYGEVTLGATWAEYVVAPASALARKPRGLTFEQAGSLPIAALTALEAVRDHGQVQVGARVLVNGASGGVGSYVVQLAKAAGAEVTAVCTGTGLERAREFGAAHVIDYTKEDFTRSARAPDAERYDVMLDVAGSRTLAECLTVLKPGGTYVAIGGPVDDPWIKPLLRLLWIALRGAFAKQRVVIFVSKPCRENLDALSTLIAAGDLAPTYESSCDLADLPAAMRDVEAGRRSGKVAIRIARALAEDATTTLTPGPGTERRARASGEAERTLRAWSLAERRVLSSKPVPPARDRALSRSGPAANEEPDVSEAGTP